MFSISFLLFVYATATFADPFFPNINEGNARIVPQQVPQQSDQLYSSRVPQLFMERNQNSFPILQQGMMQGFQSPFPVNPLNQQQLSLLMMSTFAKMMALTQLMTMQNRYQPFSQYIDPVMNNFGQTPVPLPYVQQPQAETQDNLRNEMLQQQQQQQAETQDNLRNEMFQQQQQQQAETQDNLRNEMLQQQQQQAETQNNLQNEMLKQQQLQADSQKRAILEEQVKREFDMEIQRRKKLLKIQAEEKELEQTQKIIERQLRDEQEIEREKREIKRQILEEEREELEKKENDRKLREKEELRSKLIEEEKLKQIQRIKPIMRPIIRVAKKPCKPKNQPDK